MEKEPADDIPDRDDIFPSVRSWSLDTFRDISSRDWCYNNVKDAYQRGLMNGAGRDRFQPEETLTVAQAAAIITRMIDPDSRLGN